MKKKTAKASWKFLAYDIIEKKKDDDFYKMIFCNNETIGEYGKEIIIDLLNTEDKFMTKIILNEPFRIKYLSIIYNILIRSKIEKKIFYDNIIFLSVKMSDKLIYLLRNEINEQILQLIYFGSLYISYKFETGKSIQSSTFECLKGCLINADEVKIFEITICKLLKYNFIVSYPEDILQIFENIEDTGKNKQLDCFCRLIIKFSMFTNRLAAKKTSLIVLSAYYFGKLKLIKQFKWSYQIQFITGYDKKQIVENIKEIIYEIKYNYNIFYNLLTNNFDNSIFNIEK